ncbi:alpha/beta hydrolase [Chryseobacterium lactis]|uniref:Alpha/beta hydrolase n=1 Tax=Chryseobacterium lactis TaxID=1241981 RepID=A0A3G6RNT2_CHRLC|nr:alpha/beta hydrolase [Chryseobacterium lactis]AZA83152.1 alpha/beta hydrolase [Chryseobacterium lactis]AZB03536.1 alpha/beta hydrolase [Chryseobacterium lactis]PNW11958.1 alpha/beta hydrolase [Chryseobacterium lactis]
MKTIRKISVASLLCLSLFTVVTMSCTEENEPPTLQEIQNRDHQTAKTQWVNVKGVAFAYRVLGKEDGIPLVLLPGLGGSMDDWDPAVTNGLSKKYKVIIFDNKGVATSKGDTPNTVQAMADDAIDFIQTLNLNKVNIMGFSMGGFVAQRLVLTNPSLINKVILTGTGPQGAIGLSNLPNIIAGTAGLSPEASFLKFGFTESATSIAAGKASFARIQLRTHERDLPLSDASSNSQFTAVLSWAQPNTNALTELKNIKNPVLIVHGENDLPVSVQNAKNTAQNIEHAELVILPDSGHASFFQNHGAFVSKAIEFLSK